jgi:hypothetical protein
MRVAAKVEGLAVVGDGDGLGFDTAAFPWAASAIAARTVDGGFGGGEAVHGQEAEVAFAPR